MNNTSPGFLEGQIRGYRSSEKSSICCIGNKIYFRLANISKYAELIVLSTSTLTEIGHVLLNGKGSYETFNNSDIATFGMKRDQDSYYFDDDDEYNNYNDDNKNKDAESNNSIQTLRRSIQDIQRRIVRLEQQGIYDGNEIETLELY